MTRREEHVKEIKDIETLYKNVESDLEIELTDREKVIISLLAFDYKGIQLVNGNKKISRIGYIMLRYPNKCSDEDRQKIYSDFENAVKQFAETRNMEVHISKSPDHTEYRDLPIFKIHMNGRSDDVSSFMSFFDIVSNSGYYKSRIPMR